MYRALKIVRSEMCCQGSDSFERDVLKQLRDGVGREFVCQLIDDFEHRGPNGTHVCLVFELMGETLQTFGLWFEDSMIPEPLMRRFTTQLICALDFAHHHNVIHTGASRVTAFNFSIVPLTVRRHQARQYLCQIQRFHPAFLSSRLQ